MTREYYELIMQILIFIIIMIFYTTYPKPEITVISCFYYQISSNYELALVIVVVFVKNSGKSTPSNRGKSYPS